VRFSTVGSALPHEIRNSKFSTSFLSAEGPLLTSSPFRYLTAVSAAPACPKGLTKCFTQWAISYTGYKPSSNFVSPSDAAWDAFAKGLGLSKMTDLKNFEMVLNEALRDQAKPGATSSKVKIGPQAICNQCTNDPGLRICKPCKKAGRL